MKNVIVMAMLCVFMAGCSTTRQVVPIASLTHLAPGNALIEVHYNWNFEASNVGIYDGVEYIGSLHRGGTLSWARPGGKMCLVYGQPQDPRVRVDITGGRVCQDVEAGKAYHFVLVARGSDLDNLELSLGK